MSAPRPVAAAALEDFRSGVASVSGDEPASLDLVLDLQVNLAMEVGRTTITVRDLLQLTAGSVVELDRGVSEAFDVLINGTLLAHGEPVVVNERCGVRFTDVILPNERRHYSGP